MPKRRTADEAFYMPPSVREFIDHGIDDYGDTTESDGSAALNSRADEVHAGRRVVELESTVAHSDKRRDSTGMSAKANTPPDELSRTYAKATVQKTIRFQPALIAELERYVRSQELDGEKPISFQQIQNEALLLWIERHVRAAP